MYRIDNATSVGTLAPSTQPGPQPDAYWTGGNPSTGMAATKVDAEFLNMLQEEICNVITNEGQLGPVLSKSQRDQLLHAIRREVTNAGGTPGAPPPLPSLDYRTVSQPHTSPVPCQNGNRIVTCCQCQLPAGNWDLWGQIGYALNTNQLVYFLGGAIGVGQNTDWVDGSTGLSTGLRPNQQFSTPPYPAGIIECYVGHAVVNLTANTTIYLLSMCDYDIGATSIGCYGYMGAMRL